MISIDDRNEFMKIIDDYNMYMEEIGIVKEKEHYTNCYFLKNKVLQLIERRKLYYEKQGNNVILYEKEEGFYRLYYWINDIENVKKIKNNLPVVIEFPYSKELSQKNEIELGLISKLGFVLGRESSQMVMKKEEVIWKDELLDGKIRFDYPKIDDYKRIKELLFMSFNALFAFLPTDEQLKTLINNHNIIVAYYDEEIVGALNTEQINNTVWIRHICIDKKYQGKNIGSSLHNEGCKRRINKVKEFRCWVDIHNILAVKMYQRQGYCFNNRKANEYVKYP